MMIDDDDGSSPSRTGHTRHGQHVAPRRPAAVARTTPMPARRCRHWTGPWPRPPPTSSTCTDAALGDWRRSDSPATTAALNATCLAEYAERDLAVIADRVAADADAVWHQVLPQLPDDLEVPFHAGATTTIVPIMGVLLTEMLVHGRDIADAAGRPWDVGDDDAWCALTAVAPLLSAWRRPDAAADTIAIPGPAGAALRLTFTPSSVESTVGPIDDADRIVDATPSQAVLAILGRPTDDTLLVTLGQRFGPF